MEQTNVSFVWMKWMCNPLQQCGTLSSSSSFTSDSSGSSESGLDVAVRGLSGGLMLPSQSGLEALPPDHMRFCVFVRVCSCKSLCSVVVREASGKAHVLTVVLV